MANNIVLVLGYGAINPIVYNVSNNYIYYYPAPGTYYQYLGLGNSVDSVAMAETSAHDVVYHIGTFGVGTIVYTTGEMTTPFAGANKYYRYFGDDSVATQYILKIDNNGVVTIFGVYAP